MTVYDAIVLRLSEKRGGNILPTKVIKTVSKFLAEVVGLEDAKDFSLLDLLSVVDEAWEKSESENAPEFVKRKVTRWVNNDPGEKMGEDAKELVSAEEEVEDIETLCGPSGGNPRGLKTLAADKIKMMLTGMRIVVLAIALELGRVPGAGDVAGVVFYGSDPRLSDMAKQRRKAGLTTLKQILESKDNVRIMLNDHFMDIVRQYSAAGQIQEASLVTQFWSETQALSQDDDAIVMYLTEYFKKYTGRGIPVTVDVLVALRVFGARSNSGSPALVNDLKSMLQASKSEISELKRQLDTVKNQMGQMKNNLSNGTPAGKGGKGRGGRGGRGIQGAGFERNLDYVQCHNCGEFGHYAADCPKLADKDDKKD